MLRLFFSSMFVLSFFSVAFGNLDSVVSEGDLRIMGGGSLVFSDGSIQSTAQLQGPKGDTGQAGQNGANGLNSLVLVTNEPTGNNCLYGGVKIQVGLDQNRSGVLDITEITQTRYVCNGSSISNLVGTYVGFAPLTPTGEGVTLTYTVNSDGKLTGTFTDHTDNNQIYHVVGYVNLVSGSMNIFFQLTSGNLVLISGTPTGGVWSKSGNASEPAANGSYSAVRQ